MFRPVCAAAAMLTITAPAFAAPLSFADVLGTFGAVTQSYSGNSESEGRVIVDGDVTGTVIVNDREQGTAADGFADLIITGDASGATIKVGQSGDLTIGGDLNNTNLELNGADGQTVTLGGTRSGGNFNQNGDILVENAASLNIPDVDFDDFVSQSQTLGALEGATSLTTNASGQRVFGGSSVLNLDFSALSSGTGVFDLTGLSDGLLINVAGTGGDFDLGFVDFMGVSVLDAAQSVVWNFFEATGVINFDVTVFGHVIAPQATINLNSSNEGTIVAGSIFSNNGELHPLAYAGTLPSPEIAAVPLPAGVWLMLSAIAGMAGARRFARRA